MKTIKTLFLALLRNRKCENNMEKFFIDGIRYRVKSSGSSVTVIGGENKYSGDVIIPASVKYNGKTYKVTEIGEDAFSYCDGLTSVTIVNPETKIGRSAFYGTPWQENQGK